MLSLGASLLTNFGTGLTGNAALVVGNGSTGLLNVAQQAPTIGLVIAITLVLMILIGGLGFFLYKSA